MDASLAPPEDHALDRLLAASAAHACQSGPASEAALQAAWLVLDAALARAFAALRHPDCVRLLGPVVRGATMARGARVPGTSYELDPLKAAFDIGVLAGWPDDGGPDRHAAAAQAACASDSLGGILAVADFLSRNAPAQGRAPLVMRNVLDALVIAAELRGGDSLVADCRAASLDPASLVRFATTAVVTRMLGCDEATVTNALTHALLDGAAPHPEAGIDGRAMPRPWSVADANSRAVRLALLALGGEPRCVLPARFERPHDALASLLERHPLLGPRAAAPRAIELQLERSPVTRHCASRLEAAIAAHYPASQANRIVAMLHDRAALAETPVHDFVAALVRN